VLDGSHSLLALDQFDIKNIFLHGNLEEKVNMEQHLGFVAQGKSNWFVSYDTQAIFTCLIWNDQP